MRKESITQAELKELLDYDPETGIFKWKVDRPYVVKAGDIAGSINGKGYVTIQIRPKTYQAHRLAWLYMTGKWPEAHMDHVNGNRADNGWLNLRQATPAENMQNKCVYANNKSGYPGVSYRDDMKKFEAYIRVAGKHRRIGWYRTFEEACEARDEAKATLHTFQPKQRGV